VRIYIAGSLISVIDREKAHSFYEFLATICKEIGHEPYLPHQNSDPVFNSELTNDEVFERDVTNLFNSNMILASITEPSTGVGAEIGMALENGKEVVAVYNKESTPSRFILGLLNRYHAPIIAYDDRDDCKEQLMTYLDKNRVKSISP